eukprot:TRINITY_DN6230_c0_g1_i2.p1 TRINITY_DN6230_c0_g1~~TRINITY_DN6230_c0_g1_i2.p1  ORF type:complete len:102 (-),score=26.59 TRINITY_DN6230_c0_g1_i2:540-845(-)
MMKLAVLGLTLVVFLQFEPSQSQSDKLGPECFACKCPRNLDFECGSDGRTYQNDCLFKCAQEKCPDKTRSVVITRKGQCEDPKAEKMTVEVEEDKFLFTED